MSWIKNISYSDPKEMPLLAEPEKKDHSKNALDVMAEAEALFSVYYPPATWGYDGDHPTVEKGKNQGQPLYKWVVREDTNEPLGLHSGNYGGTSSYRYLGEMAEQLFPNSTESCTLFGKGERMALAQNIGDPIDLGDGDVIKPQVLWISSFNAQWSTAVYHLTQRWFCMNQLAGNTPIFSVKHTKNHNLTFEQRSGILEGAMEHAHTLARMARALKDQSYTDNEFKALVKQVVPMPKPFNKDGDIHAIAEKRMKENRDAMELTWRTECTEFGTVRKHVKSPSEMVDVFDGNKWLAYNAVQGAEQHNINAQFNTGDEGKQRSMIKMINGVTPFAGRALDILSAV